MVGGATTPAISLSNNNQRGNNSKLTEGTEINLGLGDFPRLKASSSTSGNVGALNPGCSLTGNEENQWSSL